MEKTEKALHTKRVLEPAGWILQLLTGLLLAILVTFHFYEIHFASHNAMEFDKVVERLSDTGYKVMYALLLLSVSFHAFNGLRAIAFDTEFGLRNSRTINAITALIILGAFFYGLSLLVMF
jgi:succinate dehydrogenase / fumarate reductase membrane anchor subunit